MKQKNNRGIYETLSSDLSKKIILNNDNDDRRRLFENCALKAKRVCNPIIDWTDRDVWGYLEAEKLPVNPLYQCGFYRVGCVGCPMAGKAGRRRDFARYPKYRTAYIAAFGRMLEERRRGKTDGSWKSGTTGLDVFHWWMKDGVLPGQLNFDDLAGYMAIVMATGQTGAEITQDIAPTLNCNHEQTIVAGIDCRNGKENGDLCGTLQAKPSGGFSLNCTHPVRIGGIVRRRTPMECERLQGYPDGWTDIGAWTDSKGKFHKESSAAARYKALGNSIALPPWAWVLKRLCGCYERPATMASLFDGIGGFPLI